VSPRTRSSRLAEAVAADAAIANAVVSDVVVTDTVIPDFFTAGDILLQGDVVTAMMRPGHPVMGQLHLCCHQ
jgi:hypothetical protein